MATYVISDFHFGHKNILKFERKQFEDIQTHDDYIITQMNKIKPTDELWVLGDVGDLNSVRHIMCRKYLITGNHDKRPKKEYLSAFAEVYDTPIYLKENIVLSHIPLPVTSGTLNVHGHLHGSFIDKPNYLNVSIHMVDYKAVGMQKIYDLAADLFRDDYRFLQEWFAEDYTFTIPRRDIVTAPNGRILINETKRLRRELFKEREVRQNED